MHEIFVMHFYVLNLKKKFFQDIIAGANTVQDSLWKINTQKHTPHGIVTCVFD